MRSIPPTQARILRVDTWLPSLSSRYFLCISAAEYNTGDWRELRLEDMTFKPRDDALASIDSLSLCEPFFMAGPYQEFDLAKQRSWELAKESLLDVSCPLLIGKNKAVAEEAKGTVAICLYTPSHDMFVQKPFPLVVSEYRPRLVTMKGSQIPMAIPELSAIAPGSYDPGATDWASFRVSLCSLME